MYEFNSAVRPTVFFIAGFGINIVWKVDYHCNADKQHHYQTFASFFFQEVWLKSRALTFLYNAESRMQVRPYRFALSVGQTIVSFLLECAYAQM